MKDIFEIKSKYQTLEATLNEMVEGGEIDQQCVENTLASISGDLRERCIELSKSIKNREAEICALEARNQEIKDRLKQNANRIKRLESTVDYLKGAVSSSLHALDEDEIDTPDLRIREVGKKAAVNVVDIDSVHRDFLIQKTSYTVDKTHAYECLKRGDMIAGLELGSDKRLEIK